MYLYSIPPQSGPIYLLPLSSYLKLTVSDLFLSDIHFILRFLVNVSAATQLTVFDRLVEIGRTSTFWKMKFCSLNALAIFLDEKFVVLILKNHLNNIYGNLNFRSSLLEIKAEKLLELVTAAFGKWNKLNFFDVLTSFLFYDKLHCCLYLSNNGSLMLHVACLEDSVHNSMADVALTVLTSLAKSVGKSQIAIVDTYNSINRLNLLVTHENCQKNAEIQKVLEQLKLSVH